MKKIIDAEAFEWNLSDYSHYSSYHDHAHPSYSSNKFKGGIHTGTWWVESLIWCIRIQFCEKQIFIYYIYFFCSVAIKWCVYIYVCWIFPGCSTGDLAPYCPASLATDCYFISKTCCASCTRFYTGIEGA